MEFLKYLILFFENYQKYIVLFALIYSLLELYNGFIDEEMEVLEHV